MDFQPEQESGETPVPGAAPGPVPEPPLPEPPPQEASVTPDQDPSARAAELEAELARIRAGAIAGAKVLLRVEPPHSEFIHGGITVGSEPTPVPERAVGALLTAAGEAGVTLKEA